MSGLRLALMTRSFWPYCGPTEQGVGELACAIQRAGHQVEILTVGWQKHWPRQFSFRGVRVTRLKQPDSSPWFTFRMMRQLTRHLNTSELDGLLVFGAKELSWSSIRRFSKWLPVVVRLQEGPPPGKRNMRARRLATLRHVRHLLVDSQQTVDRWQLCNAIPPERVTIVPEAIELGAEPKRSEAHQRSARLLLSETHPIFKTKAGHPLVVCGPDQFSDQGLFDLVLAWGRVVKRYPHARLWILGDGLLAKQVWHQIVDRHMEHVIIMPGLFDDWTDVLQAADLYIHPMRADSSCRSLLRAMGGGVCPVAVSTETTSHLIDHEVNGWLTPPRHVGAMADSLLHLLGDRSLRERLGNAARSGVAARHDITKMVPFYLAPFLKSATPSVEDTLRPVPPSTSL